MNVARLMRWAKFFASGTVIYQIVGCTAPSVLDIVQTVFLGITAAGGYAILQNL